VSNHAAFDHHGLREVLLQIDREVAERYGVHGTPAAVLITPDGRVPGEVATGPDAITALISDAASGRVGGDAPAQPQAPQTPAVGEPAPDFELPSASGEMVRLEEFRGRDVVLLFWEPRLRVLPADGRERPGVGARSDHRPSGVGLRVRRRAGRWHAEDKRRRDASRRAYRRV
jgi:hypothetical protein